MDWTLNWTAVKVFLDVVVLIAVAAIGIYTWWVSKGQATSSAILDVDKRVDDVEARVIQVERDVSHVPTHADVAELSARISGLHGDLREIKGSLAGLARSVNLMNEHLIRQGSDK